MVGGDEHGVEVAQVLVGAPLLAEADRGAKQVALVLLEVLLELVEEGEGVGDSARETHHDPVVEEPAHLDGVLLHDHVADGDLAVAGDCHLAVALHRHDGGGVQRAHVAATFSGAADFGGPVLAAGVPRAADERPVATLALDEWLAAVGARLARRLGGGRSPRPGLVRARLDVLARRVAGAPHEGPAPPGAPRQRLAALRARPELLRRRGGAVRAGRRGVALDVAAGRVPGAAHERSTTALAQHQRLRAQRAHLAGRLGGGLAVLDVVALGVARAAGELAELALADDQRSLTALRAHLTGVARRHLDALHVRLGPAQGLGERVVPLADGRLVLARPLLDAVESLLHLGGEGDVDDRREVLAEHAVDGLAELGRVQAALLLAHVVALLDDLDGRGVRRGPPDAALLELLDERRLGVPRRRLREVLLATEVDAGELLAGLEGGQHVLLALLLLVALPHLLEAVELEDRAAGPEEVVAGGQRRARVEEASRRHLAGHEPAPDQVVQAVLRRVELVAQRLRCARDIGRPHRLVRVLHVGRDRRAAGPPRCAGTACRTAR